MRIDIITCLPEIFEGSLSTSIIGRAVKNKKVEINIHNLRDYSLNKHRKVDDYQYGGGSGMVLMIEPISNCIDFLKKNIQYDEIIYMCPDGELLNQSISNKLSLSENLIVLCGHYKGIDERIREHFITKEISIGEYVISGGELAAAVLSDSIVRLIPGVLSDATSALTDSFQNSIIAAPIYTRPSNFKGLKIPEVLLSGNNKEIEEWRNNQALTRTEARNKNIKNNKHKFSM